MVDLVPGAPGSFESANVDHVCLMLAPRPDRGRRAASRRAQAIETIGEPMIRYGATGNGPSRVSPRPGRQRRRAQGAGRCPLRSRRRAGAASRRRRAHLSPRRAPAVGARPSLRCRTACSFRSASCRRATHARPAAGRARRHDLPSRRAQPRRGGVPHHAGMGERRVTRGRHRCMVARRRSCGCRAIEPAVSLFWPGVVVMGGAVLEMRDARVAELADARDLGSRGQPWGFESPLSHCGAPSGRRLVSDGTDSKATCSRTSPSKI